MPAKVALNEVIGTAKVMRKLGSPFSASQPLKERRMLPLTRAGVPNPPTSAPVLLTTVMSVFVPQAPLGPPAPENPFGEKLAPVAARYWLLRIVPAANPPIGSPGSKVM